MINGFAFSNMIESSIKLLAFKFFLVFVLNKVHFDFFSDAEIILSD